MTGSWPFGGKDVKLEGALLAVLPSGKSAPCSRSKKVLASVVFRPSVTVGQDVCLSSPSTLHPPPASHCGGGSVCCLNGFVCGYRGSRA